MPDNFSNTMRSLGVDRFRPSLVVLFCALIMMAAWIIWLVSASVGVYEISETARLQVEAEVHPVAAPVEGRIIANNMQVGRLVQAGDVLMELESASERLRLSEARAQLTALSPQLGAIRDEIRAEENNRRNQLQSLGLAIEQARKRHDEAQTSLKLAEDESARLERLHAGGVLPEVDLVRARAEIDRRRAVSEASSIEVNRLQSELETRKSETRVRTERLNRDAAEIEAQITSASALVETLTHEVARRAILAPIAGRIGEVADVRAGGVVHTGEKIGAIIPNGDLKIVAYFRPSAALGRIRPGQIGQLHLEGFPWTQYGAVKSTVLNVSNEPRDGQVRVDLRVEPDASSSIPFEHGLPGTVEIEVERLSPATLLLRAAGQRITAANSRAQLPNQQVQPQ